MRVHNLLGTALLMAMVPGTTWGQAVVDAGSEEFDIERALVMEETMYEPFVAEGSRSLRGALREGLVQDGSRLIVLDHRRGAVALVVDQLAYHHAAQGEIMGEPWMVSF
jgi:hypothetical protein